MLVRLVYFTFNVSEQAWELAISRDGDTRRRILSMEMKHALFEWCWEHCEGVAFLGTYSTIFRMVREVV